MQNQNSETFKTPLGSSFIQSRTIDGEKQMKPLYGDWLHNEFCVSIHPPNFPPEPVKFPPLTYTTQGIVAMCIPNLLQPPHLRGTNSIYCWSKTSTESTSNPQQEIAKAIVTQYQHCMPKMALAARVNPTINDFKNSLSKLKHATPETRTLFHYAAHGAPDVSSQYIMLHSQDKLSFDHFPIESVLAATDTCSVHIIDCDNAGALMSAYNSYISDKKDSGKSTDLFAFFSCGQREKLPRSPGLPHDIFTSCMTTPARIALFWHSRHYYCFKNGPLRPLAPDFFQNAPSGVLEDIGLILHRLVEAMAFEVFDPQLFMRVFRSDPSIAHLAANFFLATRILSFFGVQPLSIPEMPDLRNHQLWHTFDLRLDVALQQLHSPTPEPSLSYTTFLEQSLQTLSHLMNVSTKDIAFPGQLTLIPPALTTPALQAEGSKVLALYIDKSINAVKQMWYFPIVYPLFQLLTQPSCGEYLQIAVSKALCYMPSAKQILRDISADAFRGILFPLLKQEKPVFVLVIATVLAFENNDAINCLVSKPWADDIFPLFKNKATDVRLWTLLFVATFISNIPDKKLQEETVQRVLETANDEAPEVRIGCLHTLCSIVGCGYNDEIAKTIDSRCCDPNSSVRCELIVLLANLLANDKSYSDKEPISHVINELLADPHPLVSRLMQQFNPTPSPSYVFKWFAKAVLSPVRTLLDDPTATLSSVQPAAVLPPRVHVPKQNVIFGKTSSFKLVQTKCSCSSNFANAAGGTILFGSKAGEITAIQWDASSHRSVKISNSSITHIQGISNYGYPLIVTADSDANIRFLNNDLGTISAFRAEKSHDHFEYIENDRKLLTYCTSSESPISIYDMRSERLASSIKPTSGITRTVRSLSHLSDLVGVCSDKLEFFDMRSGDIALTCEGASPFDVASLDKSATLFALAHRNGCVSLFDARFNEPIKRYQLAPENLDTLSFAVHPECCAASIGTEHGAYVIDLLSGKRYDYTTVPQIIFSKNIEAVKSCIFCPTKFKLALLQGTSDVLFLDETP